MKPIGSYCLTNTAGIAVYDVDDERVLAGYNDETPEWCPMKDEGFMFGAIYVPFSEVITI